MICIECQQVEARCDLKICQQCFEAKRRKTLIKKPRICKECGSMFYSDKVRTLYCSDACRIPHSMPAGHFKIRSRDKFQCVYCGKSSIEDEIELALDHIIPRSHGGTDTAGNLVTACRDCNGQKHNTELPDDVMARLQEEVRKRNKVAGLHNDQLIRQAR